MSAFTAQWKGSHTPESRENNNNEHTNLPLTADTIVTVWHTDCFSLKGSGKHQRTYVRTDQYRHTQTETDRL